MKNRRVQIVDVHRVLDCVIADFVGPPKRDATFHPAAGQSIV